MASTCRACGLEHSQLVRCEVAKRIQALKEQKERSAKVPALERPRLQGSAVQAVPGVQKSKGEVQEGLRTDLGEVVGENRPTANRRSKAAYNAYMKEYMREWMRRKRKSLAEKKD